MVTFFYVSIIALACNFTYFISCNEVSDEWTNRMYQYYSNPYQSESYIDLNKNISTSSYTNVKLVPYGGTIKDRALQPYPYPNPNAKKEIYIQPCDGSMTSGIYEVNSKTVKTALHDYKDVIMINGTFKTPQRNAQGKYVDKNGITYDAIGTVKIPAKDESPSDTGTYYLFGHNVPRKNQDNKTTNQPIQNYYSADE